MEESKKPPMGDGRFRTTRWSLVLSAGAETPESPRQALATLCEIYWPALHAYVRRKGHGVEDAEDLVQGFFTLLLARDDFRSVRQKRGKFRTFLLASFDHYISNERDRARAKKRGGRPGRSLPRFRGDRERLPARSIA